jgi:hypothetical protein
MITLSRQSPLSMLGLLLGAAASTSMAQTVQTVALSKSVDYLQTSPVAVAVNPAPPDAGYGGPYGFAAYVTGQDLPQPSISGPISPSGQGDGFVQTLDGWHWGFGNDWGFTSAGLRDAAFGDGAYTFTVNGASVTLGLTGNAFPDAPLITLTGGSWSGGKYVLDASQPLTISTSAFTGYGTHADDEILIAASSDGENPDIVERHQLHSDVPGSNVLSLTLPAFTFASGRDYLLGGGFASIVDLRPSASFPGSLNSASYEVFTALQVSAVPEPETCALLLAGIFVLVAYVRRIEAPTLRRGLRRRISSVPS